MTLNIQVMLQAPCKTPEVVLVPAGACRGFTDQGVGPLCAEPKGPAPRAPGQTPPLSVKRRKHAAGQCIEGLGLNPMMNRNLMTSSTSMELNWLGETV